MFFLYPFNRNKALASSGTGKESAQRCLTALIRGLPVDADHLLIWPSKIGVAVPAFIYQWKDIIAARRQSNST